MRGDGGIKPAAGYIGKQDLVVITQRFPVYMLNKAAALYLGYTVSDRTIM